MTKAKVGIVLGSASDLAVAKKAGEMLDRLQVPYEVTVSSAHRTPEDTAVYGHNAEKRGLLAVIAIAGLSAALPGVLASHTVLPVIGVPVSAGTVGGMDALYSVVQMPPGVPVASVAIDGGANAAILAARIVALADKKVRQNLENLQAEQGEKVRKSRSALGLPMAPDEAFNLK